MISPRLLACALILLSASALPALEETPAGPVEILSSERSRIVLNGVWGFAAAGEGAPANTPDKIRVPGSWSARADSPLASGVEAPDLTRGIYRRSVDIPSAWSGRRITLDLRRVSTDAAVTVNGTPCGTAGWPYGEVDITKAVKPGETAQIEITVDARTPEGETWALMGYTTEAKQKRALASRGLIGDVILESSPMGTRITDVFVKPSVRKKSLDLEVELADAKPGEWNFTAHLMDEKGTEEKTIEATAAVTSAGTTSVELSLPWDNPRLWDLEQPNLYTLVLEATPPGGEKPVDAYPQQFGFREIWIEGRDFFLNGTKVRWRPRGGHGVPAHPAEMESFIDGSRGAGFNISQIWPEDALEPGQWNFWELFCDTASRKGWAIIGPAPSFKELVFNKVGDKPVWQADPKARQAFLEAMNRELRRFRNYPSIMMWGTSGNINNHAADQDPAYLGQKEKLAKVPQRPESEEIARDAMAEMKKADPTRPVFVHAGSRLGDVFTVNHYLNMLPLQEREEMLSEYMQKGDVPYIGIEFGTPLNTTMNRGRAGFGPSHKSEPFMTEYAAIYLGPKAYEIEPRDYRRNVRFGFSGKSWSGDWTQMQWIQSSPATFQELQALFLKNTWRSWRTAGVTGGMVPWNDSSQIFLIRDKSKTEQAPEFVPGQPGPSPETLKAMNALHLKPEGGWQERASAEAFREVNASALAWIAGPAPTADDTTAFTAKDHSFAAGAKIVKSVALLNDTRTSQPFTVEWAVTSGGHEISKGAEQGRLDVAETKFIPLAFVAPGVPPGGKVDGEIRMSATIGERKLADTFAFRTFGPTAPTPVPPVLIFDPEGKTKAMLDDLGIKSSTWDGKPAASLLVIGREALSRFHKLPGEVAAYVRGGGRVLIMAQAPGFLRDSMGLRVAEAVSRRAFPVNPSHPVTAGLDADDLRDWSSRGTLLEEFPAYDPLSIPPYGWRWGNRGSVSSAPVEKPHNSGWRPILEGEFDLAYSPLMELDSGKGRALLCTLDLEDAWRTDPAARRLAAQLVSYAATAPLAPTAKTMVIGSDEDYEYLTKQLGLIAEKSDRLPAQPGFAIVSGNSPLTSTALAAFAKAGGRVVVLGQQKPGAPGLAGGEIITGKSFSGARKAPDSPALRGLGVSDVRLRSDLDWPVFAESPQTLAEGLVHLAEFGKGAIVQTQFEPRWFKTDVLPMFRLSRWRHNRALAQVLANQGAEFAADARVLAPQTQRISIAGPWKVKVTAPLPNTGWEKPHADPGISAAAQQAVEPDFADSGWETWNLPSWYPPLETQNGEVVWRKWVDVPPEWAGQIVQLGAGRVKSYDTTFWNGKPVGSTGETVQDAWNKPRVYRVQGNLVKGGKTLLAIREFSRDYQGGVHGLPQEMFMRVLSAGTKSPPLYNPDYNEDFDFGDNPYRYYRW